MLKNVYQRKRGLFVLAFLFILVVLPQNVLGVECYKAQVVNEKGKFIGPPEVVKNVCYEGIVPCGKEMLYCPVSGSAPVSGEAKCDTGNLTKGILHCQLCHFFIMISKAINYVFLAIIPPLAAFMFVLAGVFFYIGGAKPEFKNRAKGVIRSVAIGLVVVYGSFIIVGVVLTLLGAAKVDPISSIWKDGNIFQIQCPIKIPQSIIQ